MQEFLPDKWDVLFQDTDIIVRYAEVDRMSIAHHSHYPVWFEAGRTEFVKKAGITYSQMEEMGIMLPLLSFSCEFKSPAFYEDVITVRSSISFLSKTKITFLYHVFRKPDTKILAIGQTNHVWTNSKLRPLNLEKYNPEVFKMISGCVKM